MARQSASPNAVPYREAPYLLRVLSPAEDVDAARAVHDRVFAAAAPHAIGRAATFGDGPPAPRSSLPPLFDPATASRSAQVRGQFEAEEVFLSVVDANMCS